MNTKTILILSTIAGILLFFLGWECHRSSVIKSVYKDTTINTTKDSIQYVPYPVAGMPGDTIYIPKTMKPRLDTQWMPGEPYPVYIETPVYIADQLNDYNAKRYYDTTVNGTQIRDTVQHNKITSREIVWTDTTRTITERIVITLPQKHIFYLSFSGSQYGVGGGLGMKDRKNNLYNVEYKLNNGLKNHFEFRFMKPIKLKK